MRYKITLIILFLLCSIFASSQKKSDKYNIDAKYECTYRVKYINDTIKMTQGAEDFFIQMIGDNVVFGYGYLAFQFDSLFTSKEGISVIMEDIRNRTMSPII
jgi:GLPGLI family protein